MKITRHIVLAFLLCFALIGEAGHGDRLKIVFSATPLPHFGRPWIVFFAQRVPVLLAQDGVDCDPVIAGMGSSHSGTLADNDFAKVSHGLDRFQVEVLDRHPDVVVIGFGTNDAYIDGEDVNGLSRMPLTKFEANLTQMIDSLQARGIAIVLRTPPPFAFPEERMYQDNRLQLYANAVRRLAERYKTGLSDNYRLFQAYGSQNGGYAGLLLDGVHPNDEGHALIALSVAEEVMKILNK